jgi:hypothetical protein
LKKYASGGVASSPQLALFGEGSKNEAFVPLPDGRRIPVDMQGGAGGGQPVNVNFNINAIDTQTGAEFIRNNEALIANQVREALANEGRNL